MTARGIEALHIPYRRKRRALPSSYALAKLNHTQAIAFLEKIPSFRSTLKTNSIKMDNTKK